MINLLRWFIGCVSFKYSNGFEDSFLNLCAENNINLFNVKKTNGTLIASCKASSYKKIRKAARRSGGKTKIFKKLGLPFYLLRYDKRYGFFFGAFASVLLVSYLGTFVWNVEIVGNNNLSTAVIESYLEQNGLKSGKNWNSVDRKGLCWEMLGEFDELSWVHINKIGTTARVEVNESRLKPVGNNDKLVGKKVMSRSLEVCVSREQKSIALKSLNKYYSLEFFGLSLPLYFKIDKGDCEELEKKQLRLNDRELPIGIKIYTEKKYTYQGYMLDDNQLKALAKKRLQLLEEQELYDYEIVSRNEKININQSNCIINTCYILRQK